MNYSNDVVPFEDLEFQMEHNKALRQELSRQKTYIVLLEARVKVLQENINKRNEKRDK